MNSSSQKGWFGKGCPHLAAQWEDGPEVAGPDYQDADPVIVFCRHAANSEDTEGNCVPRLCPLGKKT